MDLHAFKIITISSAKVENYHEADRGINKHKAAISSHENEREIRIAPQIHIYIKDIYIYNYISIYALPTTYRQPYRVNGSAIK
jgi:hypothetical protein